MKIAIFCEYYIPFVSGVVSHIQTLRHGLEAAGHEVLIVTLDPKARHHYVKDNVLYCPAIPLKKVYGYGVANPLNLVRLRFIRNFNPDVIHLHTEFTMGLFALYCGKKLKKPVVYTLHTMYDDYVFYVFPKNMERMAKPIAHAYIRKVASGATEVIGPSLKVVNYLHNCGVTRHINIVPNTVDLSEFISTNVSPKTIAKVKEKLSIKEDDICLVFVGRLGKEKSIDVLIDYFASEFKDNSRFKLFVIGDGPEKDSLSEQVHRLNMDKQVFLLGRVDHSEIPRYFHACNLFATASLTEMNSISLLEATASGLYAVHRLDIYNRDQIHSGVNGEVFTTVQQFGDIVRQYAALSPAEKLQRKADVTAYACRYGEKEFTESILNVYERAIDRY